MEAVRGVRGGISRGRNGERLWVLAGDYRQFEYYKYLFKDMYGLECIYLSHPEKLMGHRKGKWIRVGTWYDRRTRELDEILEILHVLEFQEVRSDIVDKEEEERAQWYAEAGFDRGILYHGDIKPIKVPKNIKIWGQRDVYEEFITAEEMTI